jgi:PAS domain S-box-containing protein
LGKKGGVSENVLQLLIVEDSADDTTLLLAELERRGLAPRHQRVETKRDFLAALQEHSWDAVIADYSLPQFSGLEALKLLRHHGLEIPFIMVSGVFGEDMAVAMMKAGADDYILKGNLARLAPALERELEAAQDRRLHRRATGAMQYLAAIVESSEDAIYGKNLDSLIVSWNPSAERLFGYSAEEIIGHSIVSLFPHSRRDELLDILASIRRGETVGIRETERLHKSGRILPVSVTISPIKNDSGEIIGASSIARDISEQKQAEHERLVAQAGREQLVMELQDALKHVKKLQGLLPVCSFCHKIRNADGTWEQFDTYISSRTDVDFTHSFCPDCSKKPYGVKRRTSKSDR